MGRYAVLDGQHVANVVVADAEHAADQRTWIACPDDVGPGYTYDGATWTAPAPPPPNPDVAAQSDFTAALRAIDTSSIVDPAARAAIAAIVAALSGGDGPVVHAHARA